MKGQVLHFVQLHLVHVGGLIFACVCVCLIFALTRKSRRLRGRLYAIKGFFRKYLFASIRRLKNRKVFSNNLVEVRRSWIVSNYEGDTLVVFLFWHAWLQGVVSWNSFCLVYFMLNLLSFVTPFLQMFREFITSFVKSRII